MIRPLRLRHRRVSAALALLLPIGWSAALLARPREPVPAAEPLQDAPVAAQLERVTAADLGPWGALPLAAVVGVDRAGRALVEFQASAPLGGADLLAYWSPADELTDAALLLGRLGRGPARFALPRATGWLVLYDLARAELVAARALPDPSEEP